MPNTDAPRGFQLVTNASKPGVIIRERITDSGSANSFMAPGDAYTLGTNGRVTRADGTTTVHGICIAVALATKDGPVSYSYVPANTELRILGCEDPNAEFEVQSADAVADSMVGQYCNILDAPPFTQTGQSRQQVTDFNASPTGRNFLFTRLIQRPLNEPGSLAKIAVRMINAVG